MMKTRLCTPASKGQPCVTATSAPALLWIYSDDTTFFFKTAGTSVTPSVTITDQGTGSQTINVTYQMVQNPVKVKYTSLAKQAGCTQSDTHVFRQGDLDTCGANKPSTFWSNSGAVLATGAKLVDSIFGLIMTVITPTERTQTQDAIESPFNCVPYCAGTPLVSTVDMAGFQFLTNPDTGGDVWTSTPAGGPNTLRFFGNDWRTGMYYTQSDLNIHKVTFTAAPSTWTDTPYSFTPGDGGTATVLDPNRDGELSPDNWGCAIFKGGTSRSAAFVDFNTSPYTLHQFSYQIGSIASNPDVCQVSMGVDRVSGYRYMIIVYSDTARYAPRLFGYNPTTNAVTDLGWMPMIPFSPTVSGNLWFGKATSDAAVQDNNSNAYIWGHATWVQRNGIQYITDAGLDINRHTQWGMVGLIRVNAGLNMMVDEAFGGGMTVVQTIFTNGAQFDTHIAAAKAPNSARIVILVSSEYYTQANAITGITNGASPNLTIGSHTFLANDPIHISGVPGCTNANGPTTVTSVPDGTHIIVNSFTCNSPWIPTTNGHGSNCGSGGAVARDVNNVNFPHVIEAVLYILDEYGNWEVRRIGRLPHMVYSSGYCFTAGYFDQPRCSLNFTGEQAACAVNPNGVDQLQVITFRTGYRDTPPAWKCCYAY
ncbi:MAG TPA: hypothetical protein VNL17_14375 [Verrucomicrobiae bacterium]|nr:hypothetical protein [Verrucomicrobiae bacterium]